MTAIQEAIEKIEKMISIKNFQQWEDLKKEFLLKEKQQIVDAYNQGYRDGEDSEKTVWLCGDVSNYDNAEKYYNEKIIK